MAINKIYAKYPLFIKYMTSIHWKRSVRIVPRRYKNNTFFAQSWNGWLILYISFKLKDWFSVVLPKHWVFGNPYILLRLKYIWWINNADYASYLGVHFFQSSLNWCSSITLCSTFSNNNSNMCIMSLLSTSSRSAISMFNFKISKACQIQAYFYSAS